MEDDSYVSDNEYESESDMDEIEEQEEEVVENLDDEQKEEKDEEEEAEEEEGDEAEEEEDMSEYFESTVIPTTETKSFLSTIDEITNDQSKNRKTLPILSKYEKAKIIGIRAQQISMGSYVYLDTASLGGMSNPLDIAKEELRQKRTPLLVRRAVPGRKGNSFEDWRIEELMDVFEDL
jgi:DNA-directed RNA polymerase I, II, and III subunit RPABC2